MSSRPSFRSRYGVLPSAALPVTYLNPPSARLGGYDDVRGCTGGIPRQVCGGSTSYAIRQFRIEGFGSNEVNQILQAVDQWNDFAARNDLNIVLLYAAPEVKHHLRFQNASEFAGTGHAAEMWGDPRTMSTTSPVQINFFTRRNSVHGYLHYDPTRAGYDTIFQKDALHELGHTFGLFDIGSNSVGESLNFCGFQRSGRSVMNSASCEPNENTNDIRNVQPTTIQACDEAGSRQGFGLPATPGGGGGGCN